MSEVLDGPNSSFSALHCPICLLPAEILLAIFTFLRDRHPDIDNNRRWVTVTWVCSRFRKIALRDTSLWTRISFLNPFWALVMLRRSYPSLIEISDDAPLREDDHQTSNRLLRWVLKFHAKRIKLLELINLEPKLYNFYFKDMPPTDMNQLQVLRLPGWCHTGATLDVALDAVLLNTRNLRQVQLPRLPGWSTIIPPATHLHVTGFSVTKIAPDPRPLFRALREMPQLQKLHIINFTRAYRTAYWTLPTINLPNLRYLHLDDWVGGVVHLLQHISLPSSARLNLKVNPTDSDDLDESFDHMAFGYDVTDVEEICSLIPFCLQSPDLSYRYLTITTKFCPPALKAWKSSTPQSYPDLDLRLPHVGPIPRERMETLFNRVCASLPCRKVEHVVLKSTLERITLRGVTAAFQCSAFEFLKRLEADEISSKPVIEVLESRTQQQKNGRRASLRSSSAGKGSEKGVPFGALESFKINGIEVLDEYLK